MRVVESTYNAKRTVVNLNHRTGSGPALDQHGTFVYSCCSSWDHQNRCCRHGRLNHFNFRSRLGRLPHHFDHLVYRVPSRYGRIQDLSHCLLGFVVLQMVNARGKKSASTLECIGSTRDTSRQRYVPCGAMCMKFCISSCNAGTMRPGFCCMSISHC